MSQHELHVRVSDELTLDAGWWEEMQGERGPERLVHPPEITMFEQVLGYLEALPEPRGFPGVRIGKEAVAAAAVCLRWGSYLAVLADQNRPIWPLTCQPGISRITDSEMARINIEASAALERWIDIMRSDYGHYLSLMWKACHLPMPQHTVQTDRELPVLLALASPEISGLTTTSGLEHDQVEQARAQTQSRPTRVLANALINFCWRNGPVEDLHAGSVSDPPLTQRRLTQREERKLTRETGGLLAQGILAVFSLVREKSTRTWPDRVLPFNLAHLFLVTPIDWSLDEQTQEVRLPGGEPAVAGASQHAGLPSH